MSLTIVLDDDVGSDGSGDEEGLTVAAPVPVPASAPPDIYATPESLSAILFQSRRILYPYQYEDVVRMVRDHRHPYVLNLEMGLGKTTEGWALVQHERYLRCRTGRPWTPALIIAPKSVLFNWQSEARDYVFGEDEVASAVHVHHGPQRHRTLPSHDCTVILTTYDVVRIDSTSEEGFLPHIPQFSIVIADEAHILRNVRLVQKRRRDGTLIPDPAKTAAAVCALTARSDTRYALTGTPFVNREKDLIALAKFLADDGRVSYLTHAPAGHLRDRRLNRWIEECMIIRRKTELQTSLPSKRVLVSWLRMSTLEMAAYEMCVNDIETLLREYDGNMRACSGELLALITRLRQLCLCVSIVTEPDMIRRWYKDGVPHDQETRLVEQVRMSTKLRCLLLDVYRCAYASPARWQYQLEREVDHDAIEVPQNILADDERVVVASESKIFLQLAYVALRSERVRAELGVQHLPVPLLLLFTGDLHSLEERTALLQQFNHAEQPVVLLMTRPCGGVGLNLNRSRYIFVADAWWHSAAVCQLVDRVHRIGQQRDVYVLRYPIEGSIEEFLLHHEARKGYVASKYLGTNSTRMLAQLRHEAMQARGADGILKNIVGFLYERSGRSTWRASFDDLSQRLLALVGMQRENAEQVQGKRSRLQDGTNCIHD